MPNQQPEPEDRNPFDSARRNREWIEKRLVRKPPPRTNYLRGDSGRQRRGGAEPHNGVTNGRWKTDVPAASRGGKAPGSISPGAALAALNASARRRPKCPPASARRTSNAILLRDAAVQASPQLHQAASGADFSRCICLDYFHFASRRRMLG